MKRHLFALGLAAPLSFVACVGANTASPGNNDAGSTGCVSTAGVIACGPVDAATYGCTVNAATGAVTCPDATVADAGTPADATASDSAPVDAGSDSAIDAALPFIDAGPAPTATGTLLWADDITSNGSYFGKTVVDPQGNRYFAGSVTGTVAVDAGFSATNAFIGKVDSAGVFQAVTNTGATYGYSIARDPLTGTLYAALGFTGQVTVAGTIYTTKGGLDFLIVKLDANGSVVSAKQFGGTGFDQPWDLSFGGGRLVFTGYANGPVDFGGGTLTPLGANGAFVVGLDSSLAYVYAKEYGGATDAGGGSQGYSVVVDPSGNAYAAGTFAGQTDFGGGSVSAPAAYDGYVVSLDPSGAYRWVHALASNPGGCAQVAIDPNENVYATGSFSGTANFGNGAVTAPAVSSVYVAAWTGSGAYRWATTYGGDTAVGANALAVDAWGEVAVAGDFEGKVTLGVTSYTAPATDFYGYLAKLDPAGKFLWSQQWTGGSVVRPGYVDMDQTGEIAVSGAYFGGNLMLNGTTTLPGGAAVNYAFLLLTKP